MASIHKTFTVAAPAAAIWAAIRDFGAVHRLAPGFVVDCQRDGEARIVTFANGHVAHELLVDCDDARRRLVYAIPPNERITHYSASMDVLDDGATSRVRWIVDLLPDALAEPIAVQMDRGVAAMQAALAQN
jgi:carbon monoxide dehydrogenase subunit G